MHSLKARLRRIYRRELFRPGFLGFFINPFFLSRKYLYRHISDLSASITGKVLDVGCGSKPYRDLFRCAEYIGLDIENSGHDHVNEQIDIYYDGRHFPFKDNIFDAALCSQVLEHIFHPYEFLNEINRVLKEGGHLLLTVPFVWDEHEQPNDYGRYTSFGLKHMLAMHGFNIIELRKSTEGLKALFQLFNAYIFKITRTRSLIINTIFTLFFMAPVNFLGLLWGTLFQKGGDVYLDNVVLARKVSRTRNGE